jgi:glycosylphosphatidylinositol transamidase
LNMCLASALISVTSVLNFSFAAFLAVILGIPLTLTPFSMHLSQLQRMLLLPAYVAISSCCIALNDSSAMWYWTVLGVWFAPLMYAVYIPLLYQAFIVCLLAS